VLSALRILRDDESLPTTHVKHDRGWKSSRLTPMGGRIIFERLRCADRTDGSFVRININDGVVPIPGCNVGSGLCPLDQFVTRLRRHQESVGDFRNVCGLTDDMPGHITFLHQ
jgi:acid phosphatase